MHRSERLNILLRRLVDCPGTTVSALCKDLHVSQRSLYRDLNFLRNQGYPIDGSVGRGGGLRLHPSYSLGKILLSPDQSVAVLLSLALSEKLGLPLFDLSLKPARQKITSAFSTSQRQIIHRLQDRIFIGKPASLAVQTSYGTPKPIIMKIIENAFLSERLLLVEYANEKKILSKRTLAPHGLFINFPAWYLLSHDYLKGEPRIFRLDRIQSASLLGERFIPKAADLFKKLVGYEFGGSL